jgi:uncharacterized protein
MNLFDASAWVGAWPFGAGRSETLSELIDALLACGIEGAAVSPVRAVLAPEPMTWNRALLDNVRREARADESFTLSWVPVINPTVPGWERDLAECLDAGGDLIGAVRLIPNYHGYAPDAPAAIACARAVADAGHPVIVQVRMLDERAHHPLVKVPGVAPEAIVRLAHALPGARIIAAAPYMAEFASLAACASISVELSMVENGETLPSAIDLVGAGRVLFGTHAPIHSIAPAVAKLRGMDDATIAAVAGGTARVTMGVAAPA